MTKVPNSLYSDKLIYKHNKIKYFTGHRFVSGYLNSYLLFCAYATPQSYQLLLTLY